MVSTNPTEKNTPATRVADLHVHTHFSDSTRSPEDVVAQAALKGLSCIAITDHDTIDGITPTIQAAQPFGIEVIPGVELSSELNGKDVHVLGYCIAYANPDFQARVNALQDTRIARMAKMIEKLKELGIENITLNEVCRLAESPAVGRPHLAAVLKQKGVIADFAEAFEKYIGEKGPAYVAKYKQTPQEAIAFIQSFGGVAVLAHPIITSIDSVIPTLAEAGLDGIEVYYPCSNPSMTRHYEEIAARHNLITTGGSDDHGDAGGHATMGAVKLFYEHVERIKALAASRKKREV